MKILMTGASGFIGKNVLKKLLPNNDIVALTSQYIDGVNCIPSLNYSFDDGYLRGHGCEHVEVLLHVGAFIPKSSQEADDLELTTENIINTKKLLQSDLPGLKKIVLISTLDVYEYCKGVLSELTPAIPSTLYGWSKLYCEQLIKKYCEEKGLDCIILRLGHVYGEGEEKYRKVMPVMIKNAICGNDLVIYGDGEAIRSFIYIDDVALAITNSLKLKGFNIINIVGDEKTSINELAELIRSFSENNIAIVHNDNHQPNVDFVFDNSKLKQYLLQDLTLLKDGLRKEYNYMKRILKA